MRMGAVHLTVADLDRSLAYYEHAIGLRVHERENGTARLGTGGEDLLVLTEQPGAQSAEGYSGLFHFALLLPARADLGRWLKHAARDRVELTGMSDHRVSEALYLRDPDYHGIEIYADRPRETWEGKVDAADDDDPARHRRPGARASTTSRSRACRRERRWGTSTSASRTSRRRSSSGRASGSS